MEQIQKQLQYVSISTVLKKTLILGVFFQKTNELENSYCFT